MTDTPRTSSAPEIDRRSTVRTEPEHGLSDSRSTAGAVTDELDPLGTSDVDEPMETDPDSRPASGAEHEPAG